jgi:hypothetical protein
MLRLVQTCGACPEQYDVYQGDKRVGYFRLRHGHFRAECPQGNVVYEAAPQGDGLFEPEERDRYLNEACAAVLRCLDNRPKENLFTVEQKDGA